MKLQTVPEQYTDLKKEFCSNFDGVINIEIAEKLKQGPFYASYPAWDWHGYVWYDQSKKKYCIEVFCYGSHVDTIYADTAEELKDEVCLEHGAS